MEKRRATNTYSAVLSPLRFSPVVRVHDPFLPICRFEHLSSSLVPSSRSFMPLSSSRSIPVSLSRRLIPPHFNVARCNLYVRFTIGVLRGCHCFIDESWLYNEALPFFSSAFRCAPLYDESSGGAMVRDRMIGRTATSVPCEPESRILKMPRKTRNCQALLHFCFSFYDLLLVPSAAQG